MNPAQDQLDIEIFKGLAGVRLAMRRFLAFSEAVLTKAGITSQQYQALLVIKVAANNTIMIKQFANDMLLSHHAAVQLADRLVAAKLVLRTASLEDRRSVFLKLTASGEALLDTLARDHLREMLAHEPLLAESLRRLRQMSKPDA